MSAQNTYLTSEVTRYMTCLAELRAAECALWDSFKLKTTGYLETRLDLDLPWSVFEHELQVRNLRAGVTHVFRVVGERHRDEFSHVGFFVEHVCCEEQKPLFIVLSALAEERE